MLDTSADPPTAAELQFTSSATQYLPLTSLILKAPSSPRQAHIQQLQALSLLGFLERTACTLARCDARR